MAGTTGSTGTGTELVLVGTHDGVVVVTSDTPLRRLNYFDGKFLRAEDMQAEQAYLRLLVQLSNRAGGAGVVDGYDTTLAQGGAAVTVGQGLAVDPQGRTLLMAVSKTMPLDDLIAATANGARSLPATPAGPAEFAGCAAVKPPAATTSGASGDLYLLTVGFLEALCGEEDVFGQICDDACVQSKDRRWRMEGVLFRAVPLTLRTALRASSAVAVNANQLRNRVASAYFEDERQRVASLVNGASIRGSEAWCLGAQAPTGDAVPLAVFSRSGGTTRFLDAWTARRERIDPPPRRYWAWRLSMRPWEAFLAQVLQFQCQLRAILAGGDAGDGGPAPDACAPQRAAIGKAEELLARLESWHTTMASALTPARLAALRVEPFDVGAITGLKDDLGKLKATPAASDRVLVDGGVLDLPPAGYLPVDPSGTLTVNQQVRAFMGRGVDLRFCIVTPDYVPHALEMRQHMERISLLDGLEDPTRKPRVDILVPGGRLERKLDDASRYFDAALFKPDRRAAGAARPVAFSASTLTSAPAETAAADLPSMEGAARWAPFGDGGRQLYWAGTARVFARMAAVATTFGRTRPVSVRPAPGAEGAAGAATAAAATEPGRPAAWIEATVDRDPFLLAGAPFATIYARYVETDPQTAPNHVAAQLSNLRFTPKGPAVPGSLPGEVIVEGVITGSTVATERPGASGGPPPLVTAPVRLRRRTTGTGGRLTVELLVSSQRRTSVYWEWTTGGRLAGALHLVTGDREGGSERDVRLYAVQEDPDARNPSNPFHGMSELAIPALQRQLATQPFDEPGFSTLAERSLFPPPDPASSLDVFATLDWVLFARRRESSCEEEAFTPAVSDEVFQVYWVDADDLGEDADAFADALVSSDPGRIELVKRFVKPVGAVRFPGTGSSLRDVALALADARRALGDRTILRGGRIGQQPPVDPDTLELARLQSYSTAVQDFMSLDDQAEFDTLAIMPPALADPSVSGAIVIAASKLSEVEELVFRVAPDLADEFLAQLKKVVGGAAKASTLVQPNVDGHALSALVGVARFKRGDPALQPDSEDLPARWTAAGDGEVTRATVVFDASEDDPGTLAARTDAVDGRLGVSPAAKPAPQKLKAGVWDLAASMNPSFAKARSALFLLAAQAVKFARVNVYHADVVEGHADPISALKVGRLSVIRQQENTYRRVGTFAFDPASGKLVDPAGLLRAWGANVPPPDRGRVFYQGATADAATVKERAAAVMAALRAGGQTKDPELDDDPADADPFGGEPMMMVIGFFIVG